jgi:hypothetical protein
MIQDKEIKSNQFREEEKTSRFHFRRTGIKKPFQSMLGGSFLGGEKTWKLIPFLSFLALLAMVYITNAYYAEKTLRRIDDIQLELKDLQNEFISSESALMHEGKLSEVSKRLADTGIVESIEPPQKIILKSDSTGQHERH